MVVLLLVALALNAGAGIAGAKTAPKPKPRPKPAVTVPDALAKLAAAGSITAPQQRTYHGEWRSALTEEAKLTRARAAQLAPVIDELSTLAGRGEITATRLPELFLTLQRNAQYWKSGAPLSYGQRVEFPGDELEWEYYPGEGIQLQVLGTFGEANGFYEAGKASWPKLLDVVDEMLGLAVNRGGGIAWEYDFDWEGGQAPWVSAMAEGTAIEALTNAYRASGDSTYLSDAHRALGILETRPPTGVALTEAHGTRFLQYSFAPQTDIINAFLQTLIGLDDYATVSEDTTAVTLFDDGDAEAQAELPAFNLGGWSLYSPGDPDDLSYHELVTGFLQTLCSLTGVSVYCATGADFAADLTTPPVLKGTTRTVPAKAGVHYDFTLDKPAHVGVVVTNARGRSLLATSASCEPGTDYWILPKLTRGTYTVRLSGTDLAGNYATVTQTLTVT